MEQEGEVWRGRQGEVVLKIHRAMWPVYCQQTIVKLGSVNSTRTLSVVVRGKLGFNRSTGHWLSGEQKLDFDQCPLEPKFQVRKKQADLGFSCCRLKVSKPLSSIVLLQTNS